MTNGIEHDGSIEGPVQGSESSQEHDRTVAYIANKFIAMSGEVETKIKHGVESIKLFEPVDIFSSDDTQEAIEEAAAYYNRNGLQANWAFSSRSSGNDDREQRFELEIAPNLETPEPPKRILRRLAGLVLKKFKPTT
jgi:hypothetical protein